MDAVVMMSNFSNQFRTVDLAKLREEVFNAALRSTNIVRIF
jgi:hypothetical protein